MKKASSLAVAGLLTGFAFGRLQADPAVPAAAAPAPTASTTTAPAVSAPAAAASDVSVDEIGFGTDAQDRKLVGQATEFTGVELVTCLTAVSAKTTPTTIKHVWYKDGANRGEVLLNVTSSPWRTWSNHYVEKGSWKVEVVDDKGAVVSSSEFTVK